MCRTLIIVSALLLSFSSCQYYWSVDKRYSNSIISVNDIASISLSTSNLVSCSVACSNRLWCNSFFFNRFSNTCILHSFVFNRIQFWTLVPSPGSSYYALKNDKCKRLEGFLYDRQTDICWTLILSPRNWTVAKQTCAAKNMSLITLDTTAKKDIVIRSLNVDQSLLIYGAPKFHIGGHRPLPTGKYTNVAWPGGVPDFTWMNGVPVNTAADKQYWQPGQPNNKGTEFSLAVWLVSKGNYLLADRDTTNPFFFICEKV